MREIEKKIFTTEGIVEWRQEMGRKGDQVVFTNGCFDLLHRGHIEYLLRARKEGDALVIGLNSDKSVRTLKDPKRPIITEKDRAFMIAALECVDAVVIFDEPRCTKLIKNLKPDVYVKGGDYNIDNINLEEKEALLSCGARIVFVPFIEGYSTTSLIKRIKDL